MFCWCFFFFSSRNLRAPSADRHEILHDTRKRVQFYNPAQIDFFRKTIFRPLRGAAPQIFTRAREWLSFTSAPPPTGDGGPLKIFKGGPKIALKFSISAPITFAVVGVAPRYFATWRALRWAWSLMHKFLGTCTSEIWEGQKVENLARFRTTVEFNREYMYLRNRSRYQKSETNRKQTWPTTIAAGLSKKW